MKCSVLTKAKAVVQVSRPAGQIAKESMRELAALNVQFTQKHRNLTKAINRKRMGIQPKDPLPNELEFETKEYIKSDDFLVDDIRLDGARHILFATSVQLQLLLRTKRWFIDGTFKVVSRPFYQLMSIHAFIKKDDSVKQVPLLFVLMSRRQKRDFVAVFQSLIQHLAPEQVNVEWFMLDYEAAAWQAIRDVFQRALVRGCRFHWAQRIYRSVTRCGLSATYSQGGDTYGFIRKVLALPFLLSEHIQEAYEELRTQAANGPEELHRLMAYVDRTWINGNLWRPENWSVFRETVRTNNDVEGWHRGLNNRANGSKLPFYVMVPLLRTEADDVTLTVRLVSEQMVTKNHRMQYKKLRDKLYEIWDRYENEDEYTTLRLLRESSHLVGSGPIPANIEDHGEDEDEE